MNKGLQELIEKFESKKEFRQVKLKTRQSFREDQAALDHRLSKYRTKSVGNKEMSNGEVNDRVKNGTTSESEDYLESKLESIVLDIREEKGRVQDNNISENVTKDENKDLNISSTENGIDDDKDINPKTTDEPVMPNVSNGQLHSRPSINGSVMNGKIPTQTSTKDPNEVVTNGHIRHNGAPSVIDRQQFSASTRSAVTPEPKHKSLRGIYQKNPKLTPLSTDHLDNVSLSGVRAASHSHGHKTESPRTAVPPIPSAEVKSLPADGNVGEFSVEHMVTFFRMLKLPEELVYRLSKCNVDGKRFSVFSDKELKELGMNNPIIRYFRDRTAQRPKKRSQKFML